MAMKGFNVVLLIVALNACGGGGGGGGGGSPTPPAPTVTGNGVAPASGPGDATHFFPLGTTDQWFYNSTKTDPLYPSSPPALADLTVKTNGQKSVLGYTATVVTETGTNLNGGTLDQYYTSTGGGINFLGNSDATDPITPQIVPYVQLLFPVNVGAVSTVAGNNLPYGKDSAGNAITVDVTQSIVNADVETVNVPIGSFSNAIKQVNTTTATAMDAGKSSTGSGTDTTWLVPGLGIVKEVTVTGSAGSQVTQTAEMKGAVIGGKPHGFGIPAILGPQNGYSYSSAAGGFSGGPSVGTDGTNFLFVAKEFPLSASNATQNWVGKILAPDGSVMTTFDVSPVDPYVGAQLHPYAAIGFDGTNYLVVYTQDHAPPQATTLDAVRVSPGGVLVGSAVTVATPTIAGSHSIALAFNGSEYLLVYPQAVNGGDVQLSGQLIAPATTQPIGSSFVLAQAAGGIEAYSPALSSDGTNFLLVWEQNANVGAQLYAERVSAAGAIMDASPLTLMVASGGIADPDLPAVAFDGTNYLVAYQDRASQTAGNAPGISAERISKDGILLDGTPSKPAIVVVPPSPEGSQFVSAAFFDGQYCLVWQTQGPTQQNYVEIDGARISTSGMVTSPGSSGFPIDPSNKGQPIVVANANSGLITMSGSDSQNFPATFVQTLFPAL